MRTRAHRGTDGASFPFDKQGFESTLSRQIDLAWEAYHMRVFAANFANEAAAGGLCFPTVCTQLVSDRVLAAAWACRPASYRHILMLTQDPSIWPFSSAWSGCGHPTVRNFSR